MQRIITRNATAAVLATRNEVLLAGELCIEIDTGLYKVGDGVTAWTALPYYALRQVDDATVINFAAQGVPAPPAADSLNLFARTLAGRMMLRQQGPSGLSTPMQPSFFQNFITMINTFATTSLGAIGDTVTSVGTISHPLWTPAYGRVANFATAATAAATAGTGNNGLLWGRTLNPDLSGGFFYAIRFAMPDANYDNSRVFVGLTSGTLAASVTNDTPAGNFCGFFRRHSTAGAQDANWLFATRNNTSTTLAGTGLIFLPQKMYDAFIFCPPDGSNIGWRIDNITDGTTQSGQTTSTLPLVDTAMRAGFQLQTVTALARNIMMQRVYCESDR